ncbi:MAG: MutH/Sau3AI family endonuclease [Succinivibrionaceae bacterium]
MYIPQTEQQLLNRVHAIAGLTIGELATKLQIPVPNNMLYAKGFAGQLIEIALGASAGANPIQDFPHLGIELKTIPITYKGTPAETTHICIIQQDKLCGQVFENSNFLNKLKKILWIPIEGERSIPLKNRHIATGFLWEPSTTDLIKLKNDWEEIMEIISTKGIENISSNIGEITQVRPCGKLNNIMQYGFYLRKNFTTKIILKAFGNYIPD